MRRPGFRSAPTTRRRRHRDKRSRARLRRWSREKSAPRKKRSRAFGQPNAYAPDVAIRVRDARHIVIVVVCITLAGTAAAGGGYLPRTWGWATLGPAAVAA